MSNVNAGTATAYADLDWQRYMQGRPTYPNSLKKLIYDYRRNRPATQWNQLVDIGGGVGVSSLPFLQDFGTVHLLDPSPSNHEKARAFLGQRVKDLDLSTRLEFTETVAEKGHEYIQNADLAICATTAHWIDPDQLVASIAGMLRPGGTMAVYSYWMPIFPTQSVELTELFIKAINRTLAFCIQPGNEATASLFRHVLARASAGIAVLDSLPVPDELFEDVWRIRINTDAESGMEMFKKTSPVQSSDIPSRVNACEKEFIYDSRKDEQAQGWSFQADAEWLHGFLWTFRPTDLVLSDAQYESMYGEWDRAFKRECPSGSVETLWPVSIVLATRK